MTRPEALGVALLIGSLFALAIFCEAPRWLRVLFYRGRHHQHTAPRPNAELVTVTTIAARLRSEAREAAHGRSYLTVAPDVDALRADIQRAFRADMQRAYERLSA